MNTPLICPDQRRPCPTPDKCRTDCHFNTAELSEHPAYGYAAGADTLPGADDPMLLRAEGCQRLWWLAICIGLGLSVCAGWLALLWHYDATLRAAWAGMRQGLVAIYWAGLNLWF